MVLLVWDIFYETFGSIFNDTCVIKVCVDEYSKVAQQKTFFTCIDLLSMKHNTQLGD